MMTDRLQWWEEIPLGLALLAQSYVVGLWYFASIKGADWLPDLIVAIGAGLALDLIVVTTVMGRRQGRSSGWSWATSFGAFLCSSAIALDRYGWEARSLLHVAFPLVVFLYSQHLATPSKALSAALPLKRSLFQRLRDRLDRWRSKRSAQRSEGAQDSDEKPLAFPALPSFSAPTSGTGVIYAIEYLMGGRVYIGSTKDYESRKASHIGDLNRRTHKNYDLQQDWIRSGASAFQFKVIEVYSGNLLEREQVWINEMIAQRGRLTVYNNATVHTRTRNSGKRLTAQPNAAGDQALIEALTAQSKTAQQFEVPSAEAVIPLDRYPCPHCGRALASGRAVGAAKTNGHCQYCKSERKAG